MEDKAGKHFEQRQSPDDMEHMHGIKVRSGEVKDRRHLVAFLYELMRDHLPAGEVERLAMNSRAPEGYSFTNGWLAQYARDLTDRLCESEVSTAQRQADAEFINKLTDQVVDWLRQSGVGRLTTQERTIIANALAQAFDRGGCAPR